MTEREFIDKAIVTLWTAMRDMSADTIEPADNDLWLALGMHPAAVRNVSKSMSDYERDRSRRLRLFRVLPKVK